MKTRMTFALLFLGMATLSAQSAFADGAKCAALASASFGSEVKIESATLVSATAQVPEHCDVRGAIWPEAKFAVKLPTNWNNRFYMVGCDRADWFTPLVEWVEKGVAPAPINSSRVEKDETVRTHPQCVYPEVTRYNGQKDINKTKNFNCVSR